MDGSVRAADFVLGADLVVVVLVVALGLRGGADVDRGLCVVESKGRRRRRLWERDRVARRRAGTGVIVGGEVR